MVDILIVKQLTEPILLVKTDALNARLPPNHPMKENINHDARILRAGYNGEKSLSFTLSLISNSSNHIFHYLRIPDQYGHFQLDVFILTRLYGVIIEVKNIYGTVSFDDMGQMIRTANEIEEGFHNPIEQIAVQEYRLRKWLKQKRYSNFPIEKIVVFSNSNTILRNFTNDRTLHEKVIHEAQLLSKLGKIANKYEKPSLTTRQWKRLTEKFLEAHTEQKIDILNKYGIHKNQLLKGVFCQSCKLPSMVRIHGSWKCAQCGEMSPDAHMAAFRDYYLLNGNVVSNREAREFLNVSSPDIVKQLLQNGPFEKLGNGSATKYVLNVDD